MNSRDNPQSRLGLYAQDLEIDLARNQSGEPLCESQAEALLAYLVAPSLSRWTQIATLVIYDRPCIQLWEAVEVVASGESGRGRQRNVRGGRVRWERYPNAQVVRNALKFATH